LLCFYVGWLSLFFLFFSFFFYVCVSAFVLFVCAILSKLEKESLVVAYLNTKMHWDQITAELAMSFMTSITTHMHVPRTSISLLIPSDLKIRLKNYSKSCLSSDVHFILKNLKFFKKCDGNFSFNSSCKLRNGPQAIF